MGSSNILSWDSIQNNMESDAAYAADAARVNGGSDGVAFPSLSFNKFALQTSGIAYAIGALLASKGYTVSDSDLPGIVGALQSLFANIPGRGNFQQLSYAPVLNLNMGAYLGFELGLAGAMSLSVSGQVAGDTLTLIFVQDSAGGHLISWPSNFFGFVQPDPTPNSVSVQIGAVAADLSIHASGGDMSATGLNNTPIGITAPANGSFLTLLATLANVAALQVGGVAPIGEVLTGNGTSFVPQPTIGSITPNFVTFSRSLNTTYQNSTGVPMDVRVSGELNIGGGTGSTVTIQALIGSAGPSNIADTDSTTNGSGFCSVSFWVPAGWYYRVNTGSIGPGDNRSATLASWVEYVY